MSSFSAHLPHNHGHAGADPGQGCGANPGPDPRPGGAGPCRPQGDHYHSNDCPSDLVGMVVAHRGSIKAFLRHLLNLGENKVALTEAFTLVLILARRLTHLPHNHGHPGAAPGQGCGANPSPDPRSGRSPGIREKALRQAR